MSCFKQESLSVCFEEFLVSVTEKFDPSASFVYILKKSIH